MSTEELSKYDLTDAIDVISVAIRENKKAKGWRITNAQDWKDTDHIPAILALLHSEVSEALEAFRRDDLDGFKEELADVLIRLIGLADALKIDLGAEAWKKVEKNAGRPYRHGGKKI